MGTSAPMADRALHQAGALLLTKAVAVGSTLGSNYQSTAFGPERSHCWEGFMSP